MDTPSSAVTSTASNTNQLTNSRKTGSSQLQDRSALSDISNDSPVLGLESGSLMTPSSVISRARIGNRYLELKTPGSGESLLRGQVKTLLKKVEEDKADQITKNAVPSPDNSYAREGFEYVDYDYTVQQNDKISQFVLQLVSEKSDAKKKQEGSLISEFSDNSSVWSTQANASTTDVKYEEEEEEGVDELCEVMKKMKVVGRHTRFVYDSDGELVEEEEVKNENDDEGKLKLKGLPTPRGKHVRFPQDDE